MTTHGLPLLYALLLWFVGTGAVFWLDRRGVTGSTRLAFLALSLAAAAACWGLVVSARVGGEAAAYCGFTCALVIWGWHEFAFLTGLVTGPNPAPCPPDATGWRRFRLAAATLIWHELALVATLLALGLLTWNAADHTGAATFGILLAMRLSTKLNIFAGVPHFSTELLPARLEYMKSYFRRGPVGVMMVASLVVAGGLAFNLGAAAITAAPGQGTGYSLLLGLTVLGIVEHGFLALPLRDALLWRWATTARAPVMPVLQQRAAPVPVGATDTNH